MKIIATYHSPDEAHLAASVLEGNGITVEMRDLEIVEAIQIYADAVGGIKIAVPEADEQKAREILELPPESEGLLTCPYCGSGNVKMRELNLITAMSIIIGFLLPFSTKKVDCLDCGKTFPLKLNSESHDNC
ncbi:MAG: DUF2007 domain-containing protein [Puniceicoccales bacterium]